VFEAFESLKEEKGPPRKGVEAGFSLKWLALSPFLPAEGFFSEWVALSPRTFSALSSHRTTFSPAPHRTFSAGAAFSGGAALLPIPLEATPSKSGAPVGP
jgi:hypothetical protein